VYLPGKDSAITVHLFPWILCNVNINSSSAFDQLFF